MIIKESDLEITHTKGSGPGGQNRNKRMSGVRVKHLPTGIVVLATERRSQGQNLKAALERLEEKICILMKKPVPRVVTKKTRSANQKRINIKKIHSEKKLNRRSLY